MTMKKENIRLEGIVRISVVDRKTGKVKNTVEIKNTTLYPLASLIRSMLVGNWAGNNYVNDMKITYIALGGSTKNLIKTLTNPSVSLTSGSGYYGAVFSAQDSSSDSYTVNYVAMGNNTVLGGPSSGDVTTQAYFAQALSTPVTKGSTDILNIQWEVRVGFGSV